MGDPLLCSRQRPTIFATTDIGAAWVQPRGRAPWEAPQEYSTATQASLEIPVLALPVRCYSAAAVEHLPFRCYIAPLTSIGRSLVSDDGTHYSPTSTRACTCRSRSMRRYARSRSRSASKSMTSCWRDQYRSAAAWVSVGRGPQVRKKAIDQMGGELALYDCWLAAEKLREQHVCYCPTPCV
jgi:hypothetical protein